jgi:hypothetical protein
LGLVDQGSSHSDGLIHPELGSLESEIDLGIVHVHVFAIQCGSGLFEGFLNVFGSVFGIFDLSDQIVGFVIIAGVHQEETLVDVLDHGLEVVDHLVNSLGFSDLLFLIGLHQVGHLGSVSEGDFQFAEILGESNDLHLNVSLGVGLHLSNSDDLIILGQRRSVDGHGGGSDGLIEHSVEFFVLLHVVVD